MNTLPCAIYTRKSSEEGLEQDFNSLDAQREACEAFIVSQKTQGWKGIGCYDDGGFSGGNVERPGLQRLMSDIRLGKVKVIVVYKVDRLTRSLADFAKLVELFDAQGVSFVSVTQQFNTTSSMGRLTLNVLLSFAQFEREVTGERIRDKIAASKRKGMWMGGYAPIGYLPHERTLKVDEPQAERVRQIFDLYLQLGCVRRLKMELDSRGWRTPERQGARPGGGLPFTRGHLYRLLSSPIYIGGISHKNVVHPGQHQAIVPKEDAVQSQLADNAQGHSDRITALEPSLLAGLAQDDQGRLLKTTHAKKGSKRYRYYYADCTSHDEPQMNPLRIPARELEKAVLDELVSFLRDEARMLAAVPTLSASETKAAFAFAAKAAETLRGGRVSDRIKVVKQLLAHVVVTPSQLEIAVRQAPLHGTPNNEDERHVISVPVRLKQGNNAMRLVVRNRSTEAKTPDGALVALLARANHWFAAVRSSEHDSIASLAAEHHQAGRDITRTMYLAFLAPEIIETIARGEQPVGMGVRRLVAMSPLPMDWVEQRKFFGLT